MALPSNVSLCEVTGLYLHARQDGSDAGRETDGIPAPGLTIVITASLSIVYDRIAEPPATIALDPITVRTNTLGQLVSTSDGNPGVFIVANDNESLDYFYYTATVTGPGWPSQVIPFDAPSNSIVDLTAIAPLLVVNGRGITKGEPGKNGDPTELSVLQTFSIPSTEAADVVIQGDAPDQSLTFYIPRGKDGDFAPVSSFVTSGDTATPITLVADSSHGTRITLNADAQVTLNGGVTDYTYKHPILVVQGAAGGRKINWPSNITWLSGSAPTIDTKPNAITLIELMWMGSNWYGYAVNAATTPPVADSTLGNGVLGTMTLS